MKFLLRLIFLTIFLPGVVSAELLHASATDEVTIVNNNGSYVLMTDMKHVNPTSGDWMVLFSCSVSGNDVSDDIFVAIFKGGTIIQASERRFTVENSVDPDNDYMLAITYHVNVNGSEDIEVRWNYTAPTSIGKVHERNLTMMSGDASDFDQVSSTDSPTTTSATYVAITTTTISAPGAGDYAAFFTASWKPSVANAAEDFEFAFFVGGSILQHTERLATGEGSWGPDAYSIIAIFAKVSPTAGQDVEVRWKRAGGTGTITVDDRAITLFKRDSGDIVEVSATVNDSTTSTSDIQIGSMTATPGADDWIGVFSTSFGQTASISTLHLHEFSFRVNDVRVADTVRDQDSNDSFDSEMRWTAITMGKLSPTAGQTVKVFWIADQTTERLAQERTMVLFREASAAPTGRRDRIRLSSIENFGEILIFLFIDFAFSRFYKIIK